jgi:hypothetical protein
MPLNRDSLDRHADDVSAQLLAEWGLQEEPIRDAVRWAYENHVAEVTADEPLNSRGTTMYLRLTGRLRQVLRSDGWWIDRPGNLEMTVRPDGHIAIVVANGDSDTGIIRRQPSTVSRKGARTKKVLGERLFDIDDIPLTEDRLMLVLLVHADERGQEIRCEVSRPLGVAANGHIEEWAARAILGAIPMSPVMVKGYASVEITEPIDIDVSRRVAGENA